MQAHTGKSIRVRVTLIAVLATFVAMVIIVGVTVFAMQSVLRSMVADDLEDHLDKAEAAVQMGRYDVAVRFAGSDIMQVIGEHGRVIASSANARGLAAILSEADVDEEIASASDDDDDDDEGDSDDLGSRDAAEGDNGKEADISAREGNGDSQSGNPDVAEGRQPIIQPVQPVGDDADDDDDDDEDDASRGKTRGAPAASSASSVASSVASASPAVTVATDTEEPYLDASNVLGDEGPYLVMTRRVKSPDGVVILAAMTSLNPALRAARAAAQILVMAMLVLLVVVAFTAWRLTARTLKPVEQMRSSAAAIQGSDLSARVAVPHGDRDLAPLAITFNDLLDRIEQTVDAHKRFMSDASHELKSPIAASGVMLEAMREYPDALDRDQLISDLESENRRMGQIVGNMLILSRHDEGRVQLELAPLDLFDVLHEEATALSSRFDIELDTSGIEPIVCRADREQLSYAVRNLLDNAARYATRQVKLSCNQDEGLTRIVVSDDGPGIPVEDRTRVFDRFVRLDPEAQSGGTGLGLSVVKSAVEQQSGRVFFADPELGGATAVIELPQ